MHLILYVFLIVIMSYLIMYFVSDDKNKGDQSKFIDTQFLEIDFNKISSSTMNIEWPDIKILWATLP